MTNLTLHEIYSKSNNPPEHTTKLSINKYAHIQNQILREGLIKLKQLLYTSYPAVTVFLSQRRGKNQTFTKISPPSIPATAEQKDGRRGMQRKIG